jgi:hypothetical protein
MFFFWLNKTRNSNSQNQNQTLLNFVPFSVIIIMKVIHNSLLFFPGRELDQQSQSFIQAKLNE